MLDNLIKNGWMTQFAVTMLVVVFSLFLIKSGAKLLFEYFKSMDEPMPNPTTRSLVAGVLLIAAGTLIMVSFFMQSRYLMPVKIW